MGQMAPEETPGQPAEVEDDLTGIESFSGQALAGKANLAAEEQIARPRDDKGQFVPTPEDPPPAKGETEVLQQQLEERFGGNALEAVRAQANAEAKITEQGRELGELRKLVEEQVIPAVQAEPQAAPLNFDEEQIEENPMGAAEEAYAAGDKSALRTVVNQWKEVDPFGASTWVSGKQSAALVDQVAHLVNDAVEPLREANKTSAYDSAMARVKGQHEDFDAYGHQYAALIESFPDPVKDAYKEVLEGGDPQAAERALQSLYLGARGLGTEPVPPAAAPPTPDPTGVLSGTPASHPSPATTPQDALAAQIKGQVSHTETVEEVPAFVMVERQLRRSQ